MAKVERVRPKCSRPDCTREATLKDRCAHHYRIDNQKRLRALRRVARGIGPVLRDGVEFTEASDPIPILRMQDSICQIIFKMLEGGWLDIETVNKRSQS